MDAAEPSQRVEAVLAACLEQRPADWAAALEAACVEHPDLADALRERYALLRSTGMAAPEGGRRFGPFRIGERLGQGGMGVVYLAVQEGLGRKVALKLIRPEFLDADRARRRFFREAEAASRLDHPNLCTLYEAGEVDGQPYLAMQWIDGETLAQRGARVTTATGKERRAQLDAQLALFEKIARALHEAHERGLVHRDIKPANLMITRSGEPVVLDFGLARLADSTVGSLTATADQLGTPAYMPPEQIVGGAAEVDRRADVYSPGVTLFEQLTGELPFEAVHREALYREVLQGRARDARKLDPHLSRDLAVVLARAIDRDRARRYPSALALAEDLRRVRERRPILARPPGPPLRLRRWCQRNPVGATLLATMAAGLAVALWLLSAREAALADARVRALVDAASRVHQDSQYVAFLLAREAVRLAPDDADTLSALQEALTELREVALLPDHRARLGGTALSPDGTRMASWSEDGMVKLWDASDDPPRWLRDLPHGSRVNAAAFALGGRRLAVVCGSGSRAASERGEFAFLWDLETSEPPRELPHQLRTLFVAVAPDGNTVLTGSHDATAKLWDARDGSLLQVLRGPAIVCRVCFSPRTGEYAVIGRTDGTAGVWRRGRDGYRRITTLDDYGGEVMNAVFSPDERRLVMAAGEVGTFGLGRWASDWELRVFSVDGDAVRLLARRGAHSSSVSRVAFAPDGQTFATGGMDGQVALWSRDGELVAMREAGSVVFALSFSADGERLGVGGNDRAARIWNADLEPVAVLRGHQDRVIDVRFLPDGRIVTAGDESIRLWRESLPGLAVLRHRDALYAARFSPDGRHIATASRDRTARLWDRSGRAVGEPLRHQSPVYDAAWSPDGRQIATAAEDGAVKLWRFDGATAELERSLRTRGALRGLPACRVLFSPDGERFLVTTDKWGYAALWSAATGKGLRRLPDQAGGIWAASFLPDGRFLTGTRLGRLRLWSRDGETFDELPLRFPLWSLDLHPTRPLLVTAGWDRMLRIVDLERRVGLQAWPGHAGRAFSAAWSPDGSTFVSAGQDTAAVLWSADGERLWSLRGHRQHLWCAGFSPDGELVVTGSWDRTARLWPARRERLLELAERCAYRPLTAVERAQYGEMFGSAVPALPGSTR